MNGYQVTQALRISLRDYPKIMHKIGMIVGHANVNDFLKTVMVANLTTDRALYHQAREWADANVR